METLSTQWVEAKDLKLDQMTEFGIIDEIDAEGEPGFIWVKGSNGSGWHRLCHHEKVRL